MFITQTIPNYNSEDFVCVEDLLSSYCTELGGGTLNVCAFYNKKDKLTYFGGQWMDVKPHAFGKEPTDKEVWAHTDIHSAINQEMKKHRAEKKSWEDKLKAIDDHYKKNGVNFAYCILMGKDCHEVKVKEIIGMRDLAEITKSVESNISNPESKWYKMRIKQIQVISRPNEYADKWWAGKNREWDI